MPSNSIASVAEGILRAKNQPMHYLELTRLILKQRPISSRVPYNTVASVLVTNPRFKRVAEGVYALAVPPSDGNYSIWAQYPVARFGKDIAYDILTARKRPMTLRELGEVMLKERSFKGPPTAIGRGAVKSDPRFTYDRTTRRVSLSKWKK